jgi:hypothetical protein
MCPACMTTVALLATGATSAGGVIALVARKLRILRGSRFWKRHRHSAGQQEMKQ